MKKRIIKANTDVGSKDGSTFRKTMRNVDPQECVGTRSNAAWANIRSAHTNDKNAMIDGHHGGISKVTCRNGKNVMTRPLRHDSHQKEWTGHGNTGLGGI